MSLILSFRPPHTLPKRMVDRIPPSLYLRIIVAEKGTDCKVFSKILAKPCFHRIKDFH